MADELPSQAEALKFPRRRFMRDAAAATVTCISPSLFRGCQVKPGGLTSTNNGTDVMDQALEMMAGWGPLTNHGPMAAEALVTLGRADKVFAFVESYRKRFRSSYPPARQPITQENWREALGDGNRVADWSAFFKRELEGTAWAQVLEKWTAALAPGLAAAAAHGLIRTGHAVRSLTVKETELRRNELAEGLAYWAGYYQRLPEAQNAKAVGLTPAQAIKHIPLLPAGKRPGGGSIMVGLRSLNDFPPFADAINLVEAGSNAGPFLSEVTEAFAAAYLGNVTRRNFITLLHAVTGTTALRSLLPYLSPTTAHTVLRYGWQTAAALYSISGVGKANVLAEPKEIDRDDLIDRAATLQEEHAIKFTEACLREYSLNPKPIYLKAASDAVERLRESQ